jgi:hypothetical protein
MERFGRALGVKVPPRPLADLYDPPTERLQFRSVLADK